MPSATATSSRPVDSGRELGENRVQGRSPEAAAALKTAAATIQSNLRATTSLPMGEDEFVVLLVAATWKACKQKIACSAPLRPWREGRGPS